MIIIFSLVSLALIFWYSNYIQNQFYVIVDFFNVLVTQHESLAILVFILSATFGALISPLTNLPLVPFAVAIWGTVPTTIFLLIGWLIGDIIAYIIGRYFGLYIITKLISSKKIEEWSGMVKGHTNFFTAVVVRLALPAELGYLFGFIRYNFWLYLLVTFIAELPFAVILTNVSKAVIFGETQQFFGMIFLLVVIIVGVLIKMKKIKKKICKHLQTN